MKRHWFWQYYFYFSILSFVLLYLGAPFFYEGWLSEAIDWASLILEFFALVGVFGYVFLRRIGTSFFWKAIFIANLIDYSIFVCSMIFDDVLVILEVPYFSYLMIILIIIFTFIFSVPLWLTLYRYGFRCQDIWAIPSPSTQN